jgi:cell division protein FtsX
MKVWLKGGLIAIIPAFIFFLYWVFFRCDWHVYGEKILCIPFTFIESLIFGLILFAIGAFIGKLIDRSKK